MKVEWSPLALERVEDIARYIAHPEAATRWVTELFDTVERLADFPESGRLIPEIGISRIGELIFGAYRVIYEGQGGSPHRTEGESVAAAERNQRITGAERERGLVNKHSHGAHLPGGMGASQVQRLVTD